MEADLAPFASACAQLGLQLHVFVLMDGADRGEVRPVASVRMQTRDDFFSRATEEANKGALGTC